MNPLADELALRMAALRSEQHRLHELSQQLAHPDMAEAGMHLEDAIQDLDRIWSLMTDQVAR